MKFSFLLGTFAIGILVNACGGHRAGDPGVVQGDGATDGTPSDGDGNAAGANGDGGDDNDGSEANSDGDDNGDAASTDGDASNSDGDNDDGGSNSDNDDDNAGPKGNGDGASNAAGSGGTSSSGGSAGAGGSGGSSGSAGSAGLSGSGASGGLPSSAGFGGSSASAGAAGVSGSGGSGDTAGSGGSHDDGDDDDSGSAGSDDGSGTGGSDSIPSSGGSAGLPGTGGSDSVPSSGGSAGVSGSGGSGGDSSTGGSGGSGGDSSTGGSSGSGGDSGTGGSGGSTTGEGEDHSLDPEYLFTTETFGGNGRTCGTCHTAETGTINPAQVEALYGADPGDVLFRPIDSDDGASENYSELRARATFRATIALPPGVTLTSDPSATSVVFRRGVPTTINSPSLDPVIMWDGREPSLTNQALDAIFGHAEATVTPSSAQLELIAGFEKGPNFFSSDLLRQYSEGGTAPSWPAGSTESEQRGRRWFAEDSAAPRFNICGQCHGGPMTNTTQANSGLPVGQRFQTANVSEFNTPGNPTYEFTFPDPRDPSKTVTRRTPDPGRALITGDVRDLNFFRIPTLWGVKNTAPYFHDNSAKDLEELMEHYEDHLATFLRTGPTYPQPHVPTAQDKADIIAYLKLL